MPVRVPLADLRPNHWFLSREKLEGVRVAYASGRDGELPAIEVRRLDGELVLIDGHARAFAAHECGRRDVLATISEARTSAATPEDAAEDANVALYRWIRRHSPALGITGVPALSGRILSADDYEARWTRFLRDWRHYRYGAAGAFRRDGGEILVGVRNDPNRAIQLPQGGIEPGETVLETLAREMLEEVGVPLADTRARLLRASRSFLAYEWPPGFNTRDRLRGQQHVYFLLDGNGIDAAALAPSAEFVAFEWIAPQDLLRRIVEWKRPAYRQAFAELGI